LTKDVDGNPPQLERFKPDQRSVRLSPLSQRDKASIEILEQRNDHAAAAPELPV
jgi:hypothetical protein